VANHYQSRDLWVGWAAAAIAAAVGQARVKESRDLHWLVLSEFRWFEIGGRWVPNPITSFLFRRAGLVWGMILTPPRPTDTAGRASALRQIMAYLGTRSHTANKQAVPQPVALFPEGRDSLALVQARPGIGSFLQRISSRGIPLLPAAAYQEHGKLIIRFGQPFAIRLGERDHTDVDGDRLLSEQVMVTIGRLLPSVLWGYYSNAIKHALSP
jgi:hypothetical protein